MLDIPKTLDEFRQVIAVVLWHADHFESYAENLENMTIGQLIGMEEISIHWKRWENRQNEVFFMYGKKKSDTYLAKMECEWIEFGMVDCVRRACEEFTEIELRRQEIHAALIHVTLYNKFNNLKDDSNKNELSNQ